MKSRMKQVNKAALLGVLLTCFVVTRAEKPLAQPGPSATAGPAVGAAAANAEGLLSRVAAPSDFVMRVFKEAGMQAVRPHVLTDAERKKVERALASLPELNKHVLAERLHALGFVDGIPGEGTGLTSHAAQKGMYDITLRASMIGESLSHFLSVKERRVFNDIDARNTVTVTGIGTDALTYVLLHESSHVVDGACHITDAANGGFDAGIWKAYKQLVPALAAITPVTYFRGGSALPLAQAFAVYDSLSKTPFVSLYSTVSRAEDFAEVVAWREISLKPHGELVITVSDAQANRVRQWRPLTFPGVQARFNQLKDLFAAPNLCRGLS